MKRHVVIMGVVSIVFIFINGCAHKNYVVQPEFGDTMKNVKRIGVIVPNTVVKVIGADHMLTPAKSSELPVDKEASAAAKPIMEQGVLIAIKDSGYDAKLIQNEDDLKIFRRGYGKLSHELRNHFPGAKKPPTMPSRIDDFEIILKNNNVDCVLAVEGLEHASSSGRIAAGVLMSLFIIPGSGLTYYFYNLFCTDEGKPMYVDNLVQSHNSITNVDDVVHAIHIMAESMTNVATTNK